MHDPAPGIATRTAVLLIDMQPTFVGQLRRGAAERIIPHQLRTIRRCAEKDIPLVIVEYRQIEPESTLELLREAAADVPRRVTVVKDWDNAFADTDLATRLERWGTSTVFLMGINATACVRATANGARNRKIGVATSPNVIAGRHAHPEDDDIGWFARAGSVVDSIDDLLAPPPTVAMRIARGVSLLRTTLFEEAR